MPKKLDLPKSEMPEESPMTILMPLSRQEVIDAIAKLSGKTPESIVDNALMLGLSELSQRLNSTLVLRRFADRD